MTGGGGWTTSNNVTVVPKTGASNGYRGTISGTNRGDRSTDMPMNFVTCDRLLAKTDLRFAFYITNEMQFIQCCLSLSALYMFRAVFPPIIRS